MAFLRDEAGVILKDEAGNNLIDENGAEGETVTCDAGALTFTGQTATVTVSTPVSAEAGTLTFTGQTATLVFPITVTAEAGALTFTGLDATVTVSELASASRGGGYPDGPPAQRVKRVERRDRDKELDDLIREALNPPAMAEGTPGADGTAPPSDAAASELRASALKEAARRAKEANIRVSMKALERRLERVREELLDEETVEILLLAS